MLYKANTVVSITKLSAFIHFCGSPDAIFMAPSFLEHWVHKTPSTQHIRIPHFHFCCTRGFISNITWNILYTIIMQSQIQKYGWTVKKETTALTTFVSAHKLYATHYISLYLFLKAFLVRQSFFLICYYN